MSSSRMPAHDAHERMKFLAIFNELYKTKRLHPGPNYFFFSNASEDELAVVRQNAGFGSVVVNTAYSKQGIPLDGFVAVFKLVYKK